MATKKQKREAAAQRREAYMAEVKRTGLEAQRKDQLKHASRLKDAEEQREARLSGLFIA